MTSLEYMTNTTDVKSNLNAGKLLVAVCVRCVKNSLSHNFKPRHVVPLLSCASHVTISTINVLSKAK